MRRAGHRAEVFHARALLRLGGAGIEVGIIPLGSALHAIRGLSVLEVVALSHRLGGIACQASGIPDLKDVITFLLRQPLLTARGAIPRVGCAVVMADVVLAADHRFLREGTIAATGISIAKTIQRTVRKPIVRAAQPNARIALRTTGW